MKNTAILGAWEEPYVIGSRVEITDKKVTVLWMGAPVLATAYTAKPKEDGSIRLLLKKNGLRYESSVSDYAAVTSLSYRDGALTLVEDFPISGIKKTVLKPTDRSRYGDYDDVTDEFLPALQGQWREKDGNGMLTFKKNRLTLYERTLLIRVIRERNGSGQLKIVNEDAGKHGVECFEEMTFSGDAIRAVYLVCDEGTHSVFFVKN